MRLFPQKFAAAQDSVYIKSVQVGRIDNKVILFDSHGDIIDISSVIPNWKIKRIITKLRAFFN